MSDKLLTLSTTKSQELYREILVAIKSFRLLTFSSNCIFVELRVRIIVYSGHLICLAKEAYDSKSVFGFSAFRVITNVGDLRSLLVAS